MLGGHQVLLALILLTCLVHHTVQLKYVWGDAFDDPLANGPDGNPYPWDAAAKIASKQIRAPRSVSGFNQDGTEGPANILSPRETREILLKAFRAQERGEYVPGKSFRSPTAEISEHEQQRDTGHRQGRVFSSHNNNNIHQSSSRNQSSVTHWNNNKNPSFAQNKNNNGQGASSSKVSNDILASGDNTDGCVPSRLCPSTYNTTAPLYGVSLTSGQPVTIVQKFPDLLQQVVFQVCKTSECEVLQGECVQTYLPYLFLVIPLGPVTLTGQDYVLVESGCVCRPKYARRHDEPPPLPFIQPIQH